LEFNVPFQHKYGYIRDEVKACSSALYSWCGSRSIVLNSNKMALTGLDMY